MPTRRSIHAHLSVDARETHYRRAKDPVVRSHWQVIWLLAQGLPSAQVAAVTGYSVHWMRTMARRYHQQGRWGDRTEGSGLDERDVGPRGPSPARVGGLAAPGLDLEGPTAAPRQSRSPGASRFEKGLPAVVRALPQAYPEQEVEVWATDQHRIGLQPMLRRVWSPRGPRPGAVVQHRYQWC